MLPFHAGVYYPYTSDTQGTHSSAGIPSLLNSPLSQHSVNGHSVPAPGMTPSSGASTVLPFKFRPRRESVDWRRINAVDIDLVVSQLDVDTLQEHIGTVTFCSLDGERCQRCQSPVDPALVKLLRLAQLTVEWLLHCQEFLTHNLRAAEERLAAAGSEREQLLAQQNKQEEKVKTLTTELKQRKKVIRTQQSLLAPRLISSQKCPQCDKSFLNSSFLQNHMQRRHPDEYEIRKSDSHKGLLSSLGEGQRERERESNMYSPLIVFQLLNELSRMQSSVSEHQELSQRLQQELGRRLHEKEQTIKAQREQVNTRSPLTQSSPPTAIMSAEEVRRRFGPSNCIICFCVCVVLQIRPRSSSLPSRATQVTSRPAVKQSKTPQPAPRTKSTTQPKTSTPNTKSAVRTFTTRTPPFSSDEESKEEDTDMEEEQPPKHQRGKSPQPRLNQATPVQIRSSKASPVQARQAAVRQSFSSNPQQSWGSVGVVTKTAVSKMESDEDDWSEVSELQEIDPKQLQGYRDQNGNVDKRNFGKGKKMEQFADRAVKKPAGGVSILPERKDEVQELTYTDLEESSEWMVSSLEERQEMSKPAHGSGSLRKSLDSPSTSVWGTSTGKAPKSGLTEAGTGSTLKSSLCSLSDISDSEDISNKYSKH
uniref:DAZ interacting zinc finger protein 1 n=1 Tax=Seriola dumerili TaxID=41447 RepID=A0A3B4U2R7_SERDU